MLSEWVQASNLTVNELEAALKSGRRAKGKMVEANLRLVVSIAKKYVKSDVE